MAFDIDFEDVGFTYDGEALEMPLSEKHFAELNALLKARIPDCEVKEVYFTPDDNQGREIKMFACVKLRFDREESELSAASEEALPILSLIADRAWAHLSSDTHGMEGDWEEVGWDPVENSPIVVERLKTQ